MKQQAQWVEKLRIFTIKEINKCLENVTGNSMTTNFLKYFWYKNVTENFNNIILFLSDFISYMISLDKELVSNSENYIHKRFTNVYIRRICDKITKNFYVVNKFISSVKNIFKNSK